MIHLEILITTLIKYTTITAIILSVGYNFAVPQTQTEVQLSCFPMEVPPMRVTHGVVSALKDTSTTTFGRVLPKKAVVLPQKTEKEEVKKKIEENTKKYSEYQGVIWFLKSYETFSPVAYWDISQYTYAWGVKAPGKNSKITLQEGNRIFLEDINERYNFLIKTYPNLKKDRVTALILTNLLFNLGYDGFGNNLKKAIKNYNPSDIKSKKTLCKNIKKYVHAGGKKLSGLVKRRNAEVEIIMASDIERQKLFEKYRKIVTKEIQKHR